MTTTKEPIELTCIKCATSFRLWVPVKILSSWTDGTTINCVNCAQPHRVVKRSNGIKIEGAPDTSAPQTATSAVVTPSPTPAIPAPTPASVPEPIDTAELDTVLFIEDERLAREMIVSSLRDVSVKMVVVKNSTEALHAVSTQKVDLIVTDLYLKDPNDPAAELDGEDFLKRIVDTGANIPAIITTGKDIIDDIVLDPKWFNLHVKGFIQKGNPFWIDELKLKVKEILYKD